MHTIYSNVQRKIKSKKSLGQNFILSSATAAKIVSYAGTLEGYVVIEVGPGLGTMTKCILEKAPRKLISIEKDTRLISLHEELVKNYQQKYHFICADVLTVNLRDLISSPTKMIANLPYNISVTLLLRLLEYVHLFEGLTLMFQKEVADRIIAKPNTKDYSPLSVLVQLVCDVNKVEDLPPEVFHPPPKVYSSVVNFVPLRTPRFQVNVTYLAKTLRAVFGCRRKMIRNGLMQATADVNTLLEKCNIPGQLRAEDLSIEQLCSIANSLQDQEKPNLEL